MCISMRGDWTSGGKRARAREEEKGGEGEEGEVAMVTIKGADQTRRDEVPFCRQLCYTEATANRKIGSTRSPPLFFSVSVPSPPLFHPLSPERKLFLKLKRHRKIYPFDEFEEMESCSDLFVFFHNGCGFRFFSLYSVICSLINWEMDWCQTYVLYSLMIILDNFFRFVKP